MARARTRSKHLIEEADPAEVEVWAKGLPDAWLICRTLGHRMVPFDAVQDDNGVWTDVLRCPKCKTKRKVVRSARGLPLTGGGYKHPKGYLNKGKGRIVGESRGLMQVERLRRFVEQAEINRSNRTRSKAS